MDELDFEDETNTLIHEEELNVMKETHPLLLKELMYNVNDTMPINEEKTNVLKDSIQNICALAELQQSDPRGKESEVFDLEEGEISDSDSFKKSDNKVCRFFEHGTCFYGSHCQFLHISHKVYNMFDSISYKKNVKVVPCYFPCKLENTLNLMEGNKNAWEKGLENAKAMIQKANCKKTEDKEFESKKMYISSNSFCQNIPEKKDPVLKSIEKNESNVYHNTTLTESNSLRPDKTVKENSSTYKSNCYNVEKFNHEHKWVDPWMRSRSPRKRKNYKPHSRKNYRSSSSSSIENTYRGSLCNKFYKQKSEASPYNFRCCRSRSYSRSVSLSCSSCRSWSSSSSRTRSSSDSFQSNYNKPIKKSTSYEVAKQKRRRRKSTSLEKWFKHEHQIVSPSLSRSRIHLIRKPAQSILDLKKTGKKAPKKDSERSDSITVSSVTCSHSSSSSDSPINYSKSTVENKISKATRNTAENYKCHFFQSKKSPFSHTGKSAPEESISYKNSCRNLSKKLVTGNISSCVTKRVTSPKSVLERPSEQLLNKDSARDHFSATVNTLLKYRSISNSFNSNQVTVSKSSNSVINSTTVSKTSQTPEKKNVSSCLPKRKITLNLQPKSQKLLKLSEVTIKNKEPSVTMCNLKETAISKREILLKQLKLIENAIAKKKGY